MRTSDLFKGQKVDIPCPKCGKKTPVDAGWLLKQGSVAKIKCKFCGEDFDVDTSEFKKSTEKAIKGIKKMFK
ncbi:hypothetical protein D1B31_16250 [Neobacillus notoginsengisoli]|uniref:Uncharacterized protein n=1 Tax=Neobacillus notoginsengisoli TaxID=1578198 RepID=A0A417YRF0_9BACI|nr:hypothetical protein [Neobacillus notoginsengisoli]RHW37316.1 hypothetical protein D1B31_16250 [Neobacillus notoginsengisoli]